MNGVSIEKDDERVTAILARIDDDDGSQVGDRGRAREEGNGNE
jgi:hypothetical protein